MAQHEDDRRAATLDTLTQGSSASAAENGPDANIQRFLHNERDRAAATALAVRKLNPANKIITTMRGSGATLTREPDGSGARWFKQYGKINIELVHHEIEMLREANQRNLDCMPRIYSSDLSMKVESIKAPGAVTSHKREITEDALLVMQDHGLDLNDWELLLRPSNGVIWLNPSFALAVVHGIWTALVKMRQPEQGMIHGDLKLDNVAIPIVAGSLRLSSDRSTVKFTLDVSALRLIDLGLSLSAAANMRKPHRLGGNYFIPKGAYVSPKIIQAFTDACPSTDHHGNLKLGSTDKIAQLDWRADLYSLAVALHRWTGDIKNADPHMSSAALSTLSDVAKIFMKVHDGDVAEPVDLVDTINKKILWALNGTSGLAQWQQVPVEINLMDIANQKPELAARFADWIAPQPQPKAKPDTEPKPQPESKPARRPIAWRGATAAVLTTAVVLGVYAYQQREPNEVRPPPPPPAETYRERSANIKKSLWWTSNQSPGEREKAWLKETTVLSAQNDVAARFNLGYVVWAGRVADEGVIENKRKAMKLLASGLTLVDAQALAGDDAGLIQEAKFGARDLALKDADAATLAKTAALAFEHLAGLRDHEAALIAGYLQACTRETLDDKERAARDNKARDFYVMAQASKNVSVSEGAAKALLNLSIKPRPCDFSDDSKNLDKSAR